MKLYFTRFIFQISSMPSYVFLTSLGLKLFLYIAGCNGEASNNSHCIVTSPSGTYRGSFNSSILNHNFKYCSYRDVPYGEPPVGNRRFGVPVLRKPLPLNVIYNATQDNRQCAQINSTTSEDCLYLNIHSPYYGNVSHGRSLLPVIVWVHGGGFAVGSKKYYPDYFMLRKVVLVTVNYRLAVFGFLNLNISEAPGNQGIRDQLLALEWVQKNIRSFGGDPNSVTSMGESAGAIAVALQFLTPRSRGLINKVIVQSCRCPVLPRNYGNESVDFAVYLGYKGNVKDRYAILRYMQGLNVSRLVNGHTSYQAKAGSLRLVLGPTRDDAGPDPLFPTSIENLSARAPNIPRLMGYDSADGTVFFTEGTPNVTVNRTLSNLGTVLATYIDSVFAKDNRTLEKVIQKVKAYYFNPRDKDNLLDQTVKFLSYVFNNKFYDLIRKFRPSNISENVWTYYFDYAGGYSIYKKSILGSYAGLVHGAAHGEELSYLFYNPSSFPNGFRATEREWTLIERMTAWWTNFASTGSPNNNCDSMGVEWYPTTSYQNNYLWIQNSSEPVMVMNRTINQRIREFFHYLHEFARNY